MTGHSSRSGGSQQGTVLSYKGKASCSPRHDISLPHDHTSLNANQHHLAALIFMPQDCVHHLAALIVIPQHCVHHVAAVIVNNKVV